MPNDPFRKAQPGEGLDLSARSWNRFAEAAQMYQRTKMGGSSNAPTRLDRDYSIPPTVVYLQNNRSGTGPGYDLPEYAIQALGGAVIDPATRPYDTANPCYAGIDPASSSDLICATQEFIPQEGGIGRATLSGLARVKLQVMNGTHTRVVPVPGENEYLQTAASGGYPLLAKGGAVAGSGSPALVWADVLLGARSSGVSLSGVTSISGQTVNWTNAWVNFSGTAGVQLDPGAYVVTYDFFAASEVTATDDPYACVVFRMANLTTPGQAISSYSHLMTPSVGIHAGRVSATFPVTLVSTSILWLQVSWYSITGVTWSNMRVNPTFVTPPTSSGIWTLKVS